MKKGIGVILIIVFLILILPSENKLKDGGSTEYKALLYKVVRKHALTEDGYIDGWQISLLGKEIYQEEKLVFDETVDQIITLEKDNCDSDIELYTNFNGHNIYTVCLSKIEVINSNEKHELKDYIKDKKSLAFLKSYMTGGSIGESDNKYSNSFNDGGSIIYYEKGKIKDTYNGEFQLLECHTLDGNNDIYIGTNKLENNFMTKKNYCTNYPFTVKKTYKVEDMCKGCAVIDFATEDHPSLDEYVSLKLEGYNNILYWDPNNMLKDINIGDTYTFEFQLTPELTIDETTEPGLIFNTLNLISVSKN